MPVVLCQKEKLVVLEQVDTMRLIVQGFKD